MSARRRLTLCSSILVALIPFGCSPAVDGSPSDAEAVESKADSAFVFETEGSDTGAVVAEDSSATDVADGAALCVKTSDADEPDDEFADSNCDGIDGDKTKAVFVAPTGSDEAAGSMDAPLKTIGKAIKSGKDIYVCNGTYVENIAVDSTAVRVFGGYDCKDSWKRTLERAVIAPSSGVPLVVTNVSSGAKTLFDRVTLRAPDGVEPGSSSIAAIVSASKGITFTNSRLTAGSAADGRAPEVVTTMATPATSGANGESYGKLDCRTNFWIYPIGCITQAKGGYTTSSSTCEAPAGRGGDGGLWSQSTGSRKPPTAGAAGEYGTKGGKIASMQGAGLPGAPGDDGGAGVSSTAGFGAVTPSGYVPSNEGSDGAPGTSGGGGSGGWGGSANWENPITAVPDYWYNGGGGGQGGLGGCGGGAGKKGGGGGASIALISLGSEVTLSKTTIERGSGGRGGAGGAGAEGQPGGAGGLGGRGTDRREPPAPASNGSGGGPGGRGGRGGAGGAGGGGPSIGIVFSGTEPVRDAVSITPGKPGKGGASAAGVAANGVDDDVFEMK